MPLRFMLGALALPTPGLTGALGTDATVSIAQAAPLTAPDEKNRSRAPRPSRDVKKQSAIGRFVSTYGWRAYACGPPTPPVFVGGGALRR
ncbi:hypothetical protein [Nocardia cyriacigeorgica]|uniref:hypothetical protein n=1 Tax=Nocardia cyriacigeorgica TaxID=135487 RepID=UPI0024542571|nr:hypothetical protein [Nocardia cyriacigeorgica]